MAEEDVLAKPRGLAGAGGMAVAVEHQSGMPQTRGPNRDLETMGMPAAECMSAECRLT